MKTAFLMFAFIGGYVMFEAFGCNLIEYPSLGIGMFAVGIVGSIIAENFEGGKK